MAAWLTVQPATAVPGTWQDFATIGRVRVPVRVGWRGEERAGHVVLERGQSAQVILEGETATVASQGGVIFHRSAKSVFLQTREGEWTFDDLRLLARASAGEAARDGRLVAPINGRVVQVAATPGARIERGAPVVVLEAMKMEHALAAPVAGTVAALHVRVGEQIGPGRLLAEITPDASPRGAQ